MKLAVSNIAWTKDEEPEIAALLQKLGVKHIEIAPTKQWADPTKASGKEIVEYKKFWDSFGLKIVAFQSMLFPRPDLKIFESAENRAQTSAYLKDFIRLAGDLKAGVMVFGSPKNRQKGEMPETEADNIAVKFLRELGEEAQKFGVKFCLEPNAPQYACDHANNAASGTKIVKAVNHPGHGLHLDAACMALAGDNLAKSIKNAADVLRHFHISSPFLEQVEKRDDVPHHEAAQALRDINYDGYVSIEMKPGPEGENAKHVEKAVTFAREAYGV